MSNTATTKPKIGSWDSNHRLVILDLIGLFVSFSFAYWLRFGEWIQYDSPHLWVLVFICMLSMYVVEGYRSDGIGSQSRLPLNAFAATALASFASMAFLYTIGIESFTPIFGRGVLPIAMILFTVWAVLVRWLFNLRRVNVVEVLEWLVVTDEVMFKRFKDDCARDLPGMQVKWIDASSKTIGLPETADKQGASVPVRNGVIFSSHGQLSKDLSQELMDIRFAGQPVLTITEFYERFLLKVPVNHLKNGWFVQARGFNLVHDHAGLRLKRLLDLFSACVLGVLAVPVILLLLPLICLDSRGNPIYRQERVGLLGKPFVLYKLRTMIQNAEAEGVQWSTEGDARITRVGRFLRNSRLDELPQLWNLFKGDMSMIGPRPERPQFTEQLEQEIPYYDLRHLVPPGITGWAQVMFSYGASVDDSLAKLEYDLFYIKNHSLRLDLLVIIKTIAVVLQNKGR